MKIEKCLFEVNNLIEIGKEEFKKKPKRTKYYIDSEYNIVYSKPVDLLLNEYNEKTEIEINKFFEENIPIFFENKECENALTEFENLESTDLDLRINASKYFRQKALNETAGFRAILFQRPDTFQKLILALQKEDNDKVIMNLIISLGSAYNRYFKYFKVCNSLLPFLYHKKSEIRYYTIIWTPFKTKKEKQETLKPLYEQKQSKKVMTLLKQHYIEG